MSENVLAGWCGGCAGIVVGHPFDTVKVRLQTQSFGGPQYKGLLHCFSSIIKQESVFGLYKGMLSPLFGFAAINAVLFGVYGHLMKTLQTRNPNPSRYTHLWHTGTAGAAAGFVQCAILGPTDLVKTRLQMQGRGEKASKKLYKGPLDCIIKIYQREGIRRGVCRGLGVSVLREVPSFVVYFIWYDLMSEFLTNLLNTGDQFGAVASIVSGGTAGMACWLSTYPIDVVKSRIQADGINGERNLYNGIINCFRKSYREEGLAVFRRGLLSCLVRAFPVNAATFSVVELVLWMNDGSRLQKRN